MRVSACWIAKNEEKTLPRSMKSVMKAVDEMIVVDTGSTDDTMKVAEELGAKVSSFEWVDDFSAARNRAMELCEGEIVIFLDCDEWFEPALTEEDREKILGIFAANPELEGLQLVLNNLNDWGGVFDYISVNRILRKKPGLSFQWRIHERYLGEGGKRINASWTDLWTIMHSGYAQHVGTTKIERNIPLLEQTTLDGDEESAFRAHCYLVREYGNIDRPDDALRHLCAVLERPDYVKEFCRQMGEAFLRLLRPILDLAAHNLDKISVAEVDRKIVTIIEKNFQNSPLSATIRPYWNFVADGDEERLLLEIDGALAASRKLAGTQYSTSLVLESQLLRPAAVAAELRGETERAVRYATEDLHTGNMNHSSLHVLLRCWRGTPLDEVKERLVAIYPEMDASKLYFLARFIGIDGYQPLSYFYLNRLIEQGAEDDEIRFAAAILFGRREESKAINEESNQRGVPADRSPLTLFMGWTIASSLRDEQREPYLLISGQYGELLEEFPADAMRAKEHAALRVHSLIMLRRDVEAMMELLPLLGEVPVGKSWLRFLAVLSERLTGELGATAGALLAMHRRFASRMRVWGGVVRTGYAVDLYDRKTVRKLAALTEAELEEGVTRDKKELADGELLDLAEKAGAIYEGKKMPAMALECWQFAFAHGREDAETHMGRMIAALSKKGG